MITNFGKGNEELVNLPRKINIGLSPSRDDFPHTHINDVGLKAVHDPETGTVRTTPSCLWAFHPSSSHEMLHLIACAHSINLGETPHPLAFLY